MVRHVPYIDNSVLQLSRGVDAAETEEALGGVSPPPVLQLSRGVDAAETFEWLPDGVAGHYDLQLSRGVDAAETAGDPGGPPA